MSDVYAAYGAGSAWRVLTRLPGYRKGWLAAVERIGRAEGGPIPIRRQSAADLEAASWGLLAWEDPFAEDGPASPFWADAPMAEAMPGRAGTTPFGQLVRSQEGSVSGLRLLDGALILKVERKGAAGQVRIADGASFDPAGSLGLFLPWGEDHMERPLARAADIRAVVSGEGIADRPFRPTSRTSWCSPSRAIWRGSRRR